MDGHFFISYSRIDGREFALQLADALEAGPPSYGVWLDVREMQPGQQDWDRQLVEAIKSCTGLLYVMTDDSVRDESGAKPEWVAALKYKKPVIPVRLHSGAELPFRLSSRQFIDFSGRFDTGLARLRRHLAWMGTPAGVLQDLRNRRADAEYELSRADSEQRRRIEEELVALGRRIDEQKRVIEHPPETHPKVRQWIHTDVPDLSIGLSAPIDEAVVYHTPIEACGRVEGLPPGDSPYFIQAYVITNDVYPQGSGLVAEDGSWRIAQIHLGTTKHTVFFKVSDESRRRVVATSDQITVFLHGRGD